MVIVKFIQDGLKCHLEGETDTYKYSKNMEMQFIKDEDHQDYKVTVFFLDQEKNEGKIDIDENGVFKVGERFFLRKEPFYLSFQLEKDDEIQHLGNYKMRVCDAIGNGSSPLPEDPKVWIEYVDEEMDEYFKTNFQPKLDDFNQKYEEIKKIAAGANKTVVESTLSDTSTNPVQNKILKAELDKKINSNEIKTINGESIIGDGNIQIEADVSLISRVEKTADDTTVSLDPNTLYVFPEMTSLSISLNAPKDTSIVNEYHFIFESGTTATTFSLPSNLKVDAYSIDANKIYEVSILESICYIRGVANA